jgi:hydroxymethylpyrimidine/phosphomethylpyrimidine kinase
MGNAVPDRLFWAHDDEEPEAEAGAEPASDSTLDADDFPLDTTRH